MTAAISLVTPSYWRDFEICRLLCESIDRHVIGHDMHYIVVADEDAALFGQLAGARRKIVPASQLLPKLWPICMWRGRRYWWAPGLRLPIFGWHLQQLRKIAMTLAQSSERVICVDSDIAFCRPLDLGALAAEAKVPHFVRAGEINAKMSAHTLWRDNAYRLFDLAAPPLPGDDFIGPMIVWERETVRAMVERIEMANRTSWWKALARLRNFSEYLTYGVAVASDPALAKRHQRTSHSFCRTYWSGAALNDESLSRLMLELDASQCAIAIQSHTQTPIDVIRRAVQAGPV